MKISPPTTCPSCGYKLEFSNDLLYCKNPDCEAKSAKAVQHFAKTAKIKGLGEVSIKKLNIASIEEIYSLTEEQLTTSLGEKNGLKLKAEIEHSKQLPLELLLPAFNIPLIGKSAAEKLKEANVDFSQLTLESLKQAGIGPKAANNLLDWYNDTFLEKYVELLPFSFEFSKQSTKPTNNKGTVCITGKLKSFKTKSEAEKALTEAGYIVKSSITKDVTILVNESGVESAKTEKARQSGVTIVTNLTNLTGENTKCQNN